jgi:hypothetical protein
MDVLVACLKTTSQTLLPSTLGLVLTPVLEHRLAVYYNYNPKLRTTTPGYVKSNIDFVVRKSAFSISAAGSSRNNVSTVNTSPIYSGLLRSP